MPRSDPTFTGIDLCRLWLRNLTISEAEDVFAFYVVAFAIQTGRSAPKKFLLIVLSILVRFAPGPWKYVLKAVLRLFKVTDVTTEALEFYERAQRVANALDTSIEEVAELVAEFE